MVPSYGFDQGLPDPDLFPAELLSRCFEQILADDGRDACNYFLPGHNYNMTYGWRAVGPAR